MADLKATPVQTWRFNIEVVTPEALSDQLSNKSFSLGANSISGLKDSIQTEGLTSGWNSSPEPIPQMKERNSFTISRGMDSSRLLYKWFKLVQSIATSSRLETITQEYWSNEVRIVQKFRNSSGNKLVIKLSEAWPSSYNVAEFNAESSDIQFESADFQFQSMSIDRPN